MLQITDEARATLKESLEDVGQGGNVFRLKRDGDDLAVGLGATEEGDTVYELDGEPIIAVPTDLAEELEATLDVEHTNEGARLVLT